MPVCWAWFFLCSTWDDFLYFLRTLHVFVSESFESGSYANESFLSESFVSGNFVLFECGLYVYVLFESYVYVWCVLCGSCVSELPNALRVLHRAWTASLYLLKEVFLFLQMKAAGILSKEEQVRRFRILAGSEFSVCVLI